MAKKISLDLEKLSKSNQLSNQQPVQLVLYLDEILIREELSSLLSGFIDHCKQELSLENIEFVLEVREWKKLENEEKRKEVAIKIFNEFVKEGSDKELNIERKLRKEVSSLLFTEDGDEEIVSSSNTLSILPHNLFANCQKAVFTNMNDTHARFIRSTVYLEYIKKIQKK